MPRWIGWRGDESGGGGHWIPDVVATPWYPTALGSTLVFLLDPTNTTGWTFNGSNVASFPELAQGLVVTCASGKQPSYSATGLNNRPALGWGGARGTFNDASMPLGSSAHTILLSAAFTYAGSNKNRFMVGWGNTGGSSLACRGLGCSSGNTGLFYDGKAGVGTSESISGTLTMLVHTLDAGSGSHNFYVNGGSAETTANANTEATTAGGSAGGVLGDWVSSGASWGMSGGAADIAICNTVLPTLSRQKYEGWDSWSVTAQNGANLPSSHPYKTAAPTMSREDVERLLDEGMLFRHLRHARAAAYARRQSGLIVPERLAA